MADDFAFFGFFNEILEENNLRFLDEFNQRVSGYALYEHTAFIVRKPKFLSRDERGRLHNESGKCIEYRDGWGFWAWHGVRVPQEVIEQPEILTKKRILGETNSEVKRAMIERVGYEKFMQMAKPEVIHERPKNWIRRDGEKRSFVERLLGFDIGDTEPVVVMHVKDSSTDREYFLGVPPQTKTVIEGLAWSFGMTEKEYSPVVEA